MTIQQRDVKNSEPSRRSFLKATTVTAAGLAVASHSKAAWAQEKLAINGGPPAIPAPDTNGPAIMRVSWFWTGFRQWPEYP